MEEKNTKQESLGIFDRLTPIFRSMSKAGRLIEFGEAINQDLTNSDNQTINVVHKDTTNDYSPYI